MTRREDWRERLQEAISTARHIDFKYGVHDCALFCAYCVDRMTDGYMASAVRMKFRWKSEREALLLLKQRPLLDLTSEVLGPPAPVASCIAGDVLLVNTPNGPALFMHEGHEAIGVDKTGLARLPLSFAIAGWRIA